MMKMFKVASLFMSLFSSYTHGGDLTSLIFEIVESLSHPKVSHSINSNPSCLGIISFIN
jgi:hypothetical protein